MLVLTIVLVFGCVVESNYVNKSFDWLINSLETIQIKITESKEKIDDEKFVSAIYDLHNVWHEKVKILKCLIWLNREEAIHC